MKDVRYARRDGDPPTRVRRTVRPGRSARRTDDHTGSGTLVALQRSLGNQVVQRLVEGQVAGVTVGRPNDAYEREADRVADRIARSVPDRGASRHRSSPPAPSTVGRPLPDSARSVFELAFGYDFGRVRLHTTDGVTTGLGARAVTVGSDIHVDPSESDLHSPAGTRLLAHELTHVVQQGDRSRELGPGGVAVSRTPGERIQGDFIDDAWDAVTGIGEAVGNAARSLREQAVGLGEAVGNAGASLWEGAKTVGGAVWEGTTGLREWGWNVLTSAGSGVWDRITETPERLWRLLDLLETRQADVLAWARDGLRRLLTDPTSMGEWFVEGLLTRAAWTGRLVAWLFDLFGAGEAFDLLNQIVKFNTRTLTAVERTEADIVFEGSIDYDQVRIDEFSLIAAIGHLFSGGGGGGMGVVTFHTVNFTRKINPAPGNKDMAWLAHELTHVAQYEHVGSRYIGEALHAQATLGKKAYQYREPDLATRRFSEFTREQQGDIVRTYYSYGIYQPSHPDHGLYEPRIDELRNGDV
jgi:hypothetical protein